MISPAQKFLPLRVDLHLPTVDLAGARTLTGLHENQLKAMIDAGDILWAWDISRRGGRREYRFLAKELRALPRAPFAEAEVIRLLYGPEKPYILGKNFHRAWNCDSGHVINLLQDSQLSTLHSQPSWGRGRGNTPCLTWASAVAFLKSRRLP